MVSVAFLKWKLSSIFTLHFGPFCNLMKFGEEIIKILEYPLFCFNDMVIFFVQLIPMCLPNLMSIDLVIILNKWVTIFFCRIWLVTIATAANVIYQWFVPLYKWCLYGILPKTIASSISGEKPSPPFCACIYTSSKIL